MMDPSSNSRPNEWPIRALRVRRGMSLQDLSAATGIDSAHLELIERGSGTAAPTLAELEKIAEALGCAVDHCVPHSERWMTATLFSTPPARSASP
jgi:transcriptional regulator with XRE-family HTH domain